MFSIRGGGGEGRREEAVVVEVDHHCRNLYCVLSPCIEYNMEISESIHSGVHVEMIMGNHKDIKNSIGNMMGIIDEAVIGPDMNGIYNKQINVMFVLGITSEHDSYLQGFVISGINVINGRILCQRCACD